MHTTAEVLDKVFRPTKIAALKAIGFNALMGMLRIVQDEIREEEAAIAGGIDGYNDFESGKEADNEKKANRRELGYESDMTFEQHAELYAAIDDELRTIATTPYDQLEPWKKALERMAAREFNPSAPYWKAQIKRYIEAYRIDEAHAIVKLGKRQENMNKALKRRLPDIEERLTAALEGTHDRGYDDLFNSLPAREQVRLLDVAINGVEREARRLRALDKEYDWDDMLDRALDLERDVNSLVDAKRPLAHADRS